MSFHLPLLLLIISSLRSSASEQALLRNASWINEAGVAVWSDIASSTAGILGPMPQFNTSTGRPSLCPLQASMIPFMPARYGNGVETPFVVGGSYFIVTGGVTAAMNDSSSTSSAFNNGLKQSGSALGTYLMALPTDPPTFGRSRYQWRDMSPLIGGSVDALYDHQSKFIVLDGSVWMISMGGRRFVDGGVNRRVFGLSFASWKWSEVIRRANTSDIPSDFKMLQDSAGDIILFDDSSNELSHIRLSASVNGTLSYALSAISHTSTLPSVGWGHAVAIGFDDIVVLSGGFERTSNNYNYRVRQNLWMADLKSWMANRQSSISWDTKELINTNGISAKLPDLVYHGMNPIPESSFMMIFGGFMPVKRNTAAYNQTDLPVESLFIPYELPKNSASTASTTTRPPASRVTSFFDSLVNISISSSITSSMSSSLEASSVRFGNSSRLTQRSSSNFTSKRLSTRTSSLSTLSSSEQFVFNSALTYFNSSEYLYSGSHSVVLLDIKSGIFHLPRTAGSISFYFEPSAAPFSDYVVVPNQFAVSNEHELFRSLSKLGLDDVFVEPKGNAESSTAFLSLTEVIIIIACITGAIVLAFTSFFTLKRFRRGKWDHENAFNYMQDEIPEIPISSGSARPAFGEATLVSPDNEAPVGLLLPGFRQMTDGIDYKTQKKLNTSGEAIIYMGELTNPTFITCNESESICAIKIPKKKTEMSVNFRQEIAIIWMFNNKKNFIKLVGFSESPPAMIMRFYKYGTLRDLVTQKGGLKIPDSKWTCSFVLPFALDVTRGVMELHKTGIVHNDMKTANVLLQKSGNEFYACISDFGIATVVDKSLLSIKGFHASKIRGASIIYASPEAIKRFKFPKENPDRSPETLKAGDIYSLGMILFEMIFRATPWKEMNSKNDIERAVMNGKKPNMIAKSSLQANIARDPSWAKLIQLTESCLEFNHTSRPVAESILQTLESLVG